MAPEFGGGDVNHLPLWQSYPLNQSLCKYKTKILGKQKTQTLLAFYV